MIDKLKPFIKRIMFNGQLSWMFNYILGNNKIKNKKSNIIKIESSILRKTTVRMVGRNNRLIINPQCVVDNNTFLFKGNNNVVELHEGVWTKMATFCFENNNNK